MENGKYTPKYVAEVRVFCPIINDNIRLGLEASDLTKPIGYIDHKDQAKKKQLTIGDAISLVGPREVAEELQINTPIIDEGSTIRSPYFIKQDALPDIVSGFNGISREYMDKMYHPRDIRETVTRMRTVWTAIKDGRIKAVAPQE